ncbi:uncharacterized protein [Procambarus clarkii]|uniref:uncharacterized protein isoform X2 n=1 Tax=Procambarus clarkii TaxID=6728 RepID=UPI001E6755AA|nr:uncharacterized protein LOC123753975 isoform X2 [Procambarus clarkii]
MKYKVDEPPTTGVARPRSCLVTGNPSPNKIHKEEASHKTRNNKTVKNEGNILRRSSRRATIERRVWAVPKKSSKPVPSNVKERNFQKSLKKEREKKTQNKLEVKSMTKIKACQGTKRGLITPEEAGNARRKVKKKDDVKDVGVNRETVREDLLIAENIKKEKVTFVSVENNLKEDAETEYKSENRVICIDNKSSIDCKNICANTSKCIDNDERTGIPCVAYLEEGCKKMSSSTLCNDVVDKSRGIEETLCTDDVCLNKAIVEEVIPDYHVSDSQSVEVVGNSGSEEGFSEDDNSSEAFRNIEDVLGHSYSKTKSSVQSAKDSEAEKHDSDDSEEVIERCAERVENHSTERLCSDQQIEKSQFQCVEVSETREIPLPDVGGREVTGTCKKPKYNTCTKSNFQEICQNSESLEEHSEVTEGQIKNNILENSLASRDSIYIKNTLIPEKDTCRLLDSITKQFCTQSESSKAVVPIEQGETAPQHDSDEEDHVSLSVALAQLVDSGCSDDAEGTETVTIHSAASVVQVAEQETGPIVPLELSSKDRDREKLEIQDDDVDDEEGDLVIKEEEEDDENGEADHDKDDSIESSDDNTHENEEDSNATNGNGDSNTQRGIYCVSQEKLSEVCTDTQCENDKDLDEDPQSPPQKPKKQIPPLIKISSRPPAIKTPLKCPECPMQFCTVRSLLWHFGTHGARSRENCLPPILLQDLIVPWDKPTVSLFISQSPDNDKNLEKGAGFTETMFSTSFSDSTVKMDSLSKQDMTVTAQVIRTEDYMGTNGDVILKVPIPRLKPKTPHPPTFIFKKDKFVNILPKITTTDGQTTTHSTQVNSHPVRRLSSSPTPQITIQPQNSRSVDVVSVKPQHQVPKITIRTDSSSQQVQIHPAVSSHSSVQIQPLVSSSQSTLQIQPLVSSSHSAVHIQPLVSSSQSAVQIQPLVSSAASAIQVRPVVTSTKASCSAPSHIALIPMDNITAVGQNLSSRTSKINSSSISLMTSSPLPGKTSTPVDSVMEKDGLVMINSNLALRIVSSLPSTLDTGTSTTNTTTIRPIASHLTNNLTILPQMDGSNLINSKKEGTKNPDILTIVPQVDLSKKVSLLKTAAPIPSPQVAGVPKQSAAPSQVVKLYLLQPKDPRSNDNTVKFSIAEPSSRVNGIEVPMPFLSEKDRTQCEHLFSKTLVESDDEGMVIDDEKEGDEDMMDPLSLCAVTMEDENLDISNSSNQAGQYISNTTVVSDDKVTIKKVPVKSKGKSIQGVDIVKYEARRYVCCYCNRRFGWSTDLKRHVILHTGEKPFQCKICPTAFTRKFLLQNHMKRMHPDKCKMSDLWP